MGARNRYAVELRTSKVSWVSGIRYQAVVVVVEQTRGVTTGRITERRRGKERMRLLGRGKGEHKEGQANNEVCARLCHRAREVKRKRMGGKKERRKGGRSEGLGPLRLNDASKHPAFRHSPRQRQQQQQQRYLASTSSSSWPFPSLHPSSLRTHLRTPSRASTQLVPQASHNALQGCFDTGGRGRNHNQVPGKAMISSAGWMRRGGPSGARVRCKQWQRKKKSNVTAGRAVWPGRLTRPGWIWRVAGPS